MEGEAIDGPDYHKGVVFQNPVLYPWLNVEDNIGFGLKMRKFPKSEIEALTKKHLELVGLTGYEKYKPYELSGGMKQRVSLARTLVNKPGLVLMDEPFGALDPITRDALQDFVKELQEKMGKTIVFVTHDMDEALKLATKIVIMSHGKVVQCDTPENILMNPANDFVRELIGEERLMHSQQDHITVGEVNMYQAISITPEKTILEAIRLMREKRVDTLLVVDRQDRLRGFIDVEMINNQRSKTTLVGDIINQDVFYINQKSLLRNAIQKILKRGLKYVPVVDDDRHLVGIITRSSLVDMVYETIWGEEDLASMIASSDVQPSEAIEQEEK